MSKLGFHISSGNRRGFGDCLQKCAQAGNPVPVIFSVDQNVWPDVQQYSPQTVLIFRTQRNVSGETIGDGPGSIYSGDAAQTARNWMNELMPKWGMNQAHYYAPLNEQDPPTLEAFKWLNHFTVECMAIAEANGYKLALYAFSGGNPKDVLHPAIGDPFTRYQAWQELIPSLQRAKANGHILLLHEYGFDFGTLKKSTPYLALRYRSALRLLARYHADPPVVISEASAGVGYTGNASEWLADAKWYDSEIVKDRAMIGCCLYQLGGAENYVELLPQLATYIASTPTPAPASGDAPVVPGPDQNAAGEPVPDSVPPVENLPPPGPPPIEPPEPHEPPIPFPPKPWPIIEESASGTVVPKASEIVDSQGARWTLGTPTVHGRLILRNGQQFAGGQGLFLLYWNRRLYTKNGLGSWYVAGATLWQLIAGDPRVPPIEPPTPDEPFWCGWPVGGDETPRITDHFNAPRDYANHRHEGIDCDAYSNATGQLAPVLAAQDGIVEFVNKRLDSPSYGFHIVIRHPWGGALYRYRTLYGHLSRMNVSVGQMVKRGQPIGVAGKSGTTSVHLHFSVFDTVSGLKNYVRCVDCSGMWSSGVVDPESVLRLEPMLNPDAWHGLHMRADGHSGPLDFQCLIVGKLNAAKILTNTDFEELHALVAAGIPANRIVLRLFADFNDRVVKPDEFFDWQRAWLGEFARVGGRYVEVHNEPNLPQEGLGLSWTTAATWGGWFETVARRIRAEFPTILIGWPGLSPQMNAPEYIAVLEASIRSGLVDWIGTHSYWQNAAGVDSGEDGRWYRRFLGLGKPVIITEFSNVGAWDSDGVKGEQYRRYYNTLESGVLGAFAFISSASNSLFDQRRETWVRGPALSAIPAAVGG